MPPARRSAASANARETGGALGTLQVVTDEDQA